MSSVLLDWAPPYMGKYLSLILFLYFLLRLFLIVFINAFVSSLDVVWKYRDMFQDFSPTNQTFFLDKISNDESLNVNINVNYYIT